MTERFEQLPIDQVHESPLNPRQHYTEKGMEDLTASIKSAGIIQPLIVRPVEDGYEIGAGHRRRRGALAAGLTHLPCIVREMDDARFLELLHIENLQREDVHPLEEGLGYRTLMEKAEYDVDAIAAKVGKSVSYVYQRLKLADLTEEAQGAFWAEEITAGHAILIARLQPPEQAQALEFMRLRARTYSSPVSVRQLSEWIATHVHLRLTRAPFRADDAVLLPEAGACQSCPKRTGANPALFEDIAEGDTCTDPACYQAKTKARLKQAESELKAHGGDYVKLSQIYGQSKGAVLSHNEWQEARPGETGPNVKMGVIKEGPDKGKVVKVRVWEPQAGAAAKRESPAEAEARRKAELEQEKLEREVRNKTLEAIVAKVKWPLTRSDVEELIFLAFYGADRMKVLAERHGFAKETYYEQRKKLRSLIEKASDAQLAAVAVELLVVDELDEYSLSDEPRNLLAVARRYKVDAAKIREQIETPNSETHKPAATKKTAPKKTAAAKPKKATAKGKAKK